MNIAAPIAVARGSPTSSRRSATAGVVASFPVKPGEQLMLVTDQAKVIRTTVGDIRIAGRNTSGVMILRVGGNFTPAIEQLQIALKSGEGDFYQLSSAEARLKELKALDADAHH